MSSPEKEGTSLSLRLNLKPSFFFLVRFYAYLGAASHLFFALSFSSCGEEGGGENFLKNEARGGGGGERKEGIDYLNYVKSTFSFDARFV